MGINRIVTQSGVVWWLPPARPQSPPRGRRPRSGTEGVPPAEPMPPAGFIPLSSLGIPGIDSMLQGHADFYRDAYERAVRDVEEAGEEPPRPADGEDADEDDASGARGRAA